MPTDLLVYLGIGVLFLFKSAPSIISDLQPHPTTLLHRNKPAEHVENYRGSREAVVRILFTILLWPAFLVFVFFRLCSWIAEWLGDKGLVP